jgi:hypothetical protein
MHCVVNSKPDFAEMTPTMIALFTERLQIGGVVLSRVPDKVQRVSGAPPIRDPGFCL